MDPFVYVSAGSLDAAGPGTQVGLAPDDEHHLRRVLRMGPGDPLVLCDGHGRTAPAELARDVATVTGNPAHTPPPPPITVVHALPKGRKLDEVVRTLTELGVARIVPVESERTVVRLAGDKRSRAAERWRAVARAAGTQARSPYLPEIALPVPLEELPALRASEAGVAAHPGAERGIGTWSPAPGTPVTVAVGPEGGFSDPEIAGFARRGFEIVHLGPTVLRTEHAATVLVAVVALTMGRMG